MTRSVQFIANETARKSTYKKRRTGLFKKGGELSTLCDVDACAVIFNPFTGQPETWPDDEGARRVIQRFQALPPYEQTKRMIFQEGYIRKQIIKARDELGKTERRNREMQLEEILNGVATVAELGPEELTDLVSVAEGKVKQIRDRIQALELNQEEQQLETFPTAAAPDGGACGASSSSTFPPSEK